MNKHFKIYFLIIVILTISISSFSQVKPRIISVNKNSEKLTFDKRLATKYFQEGNFERAVVLYEKLYNSNPKRYYYTYYLYCLIELNDFQEAKKLIKTQWKSKSSNLQYYVDLGFVNSRSGKPKKAKKLYDEAIDKLIANKQIVTGLANSFLSRGLVDYSLKTYLKGRSLFNDNNSFAYELANLYEGQGDYEKTVDEYICLLETDLSMLNRVQGKLQNIISKDSEQTVDDILRTALLKKSQKNPHESLYSELLLWLSIQQKDFEFALIQAKSLDRRFDENGFLIYNLAKLCVSNEDYATATEAYNYIINKGNKGPLFIESRIGILHSELLELKQQLTTETDQVVDLENQYISTIDDLGLSPASVTLIRDLAFLQAYYLDKQNEAIKNLEKVVDLKSIPKKIRSECKIELADILLFQGEVWEATLLYSQVEKSYKNDPLGHIAKFRNARLSYYIGEFGWAKVQLDVLKAATSKLIANDAMELSLLISDNLDADSSTFALELFSKADLFLFQNKNNLALRTLDSIPKLSLWHPLFDEVLFKKAEIKIEMGEFVEADSLLIRLIDNYPDDILGDNALFLRAELYEKQFDDEEVAMELYRELLAKYPGSLYTVEARKKFRQLRGDKIDF